MAQNWTADVPSWIASALFLLPAVALRHTIFVWALVPAAGIAYVTAGEVMMRLRHRWRTHDAMTAPATFPDPPVMDADEVITRIRELISDAPAESLVLFSYGTCVVSVDPQPEPARAAAALLQEVGYAIPGTPSADLFVYPLADGSFIVRGHHPNLLTFISSGWLPGGDPAEKHIRAGFLARDRRVLDMFSQRVIRTHVSTLR